RPAAIWGEGPRPWFGTTATRSILVTATSPTLQLEQRATFNQKPRIPRGVLTALILAGIVALWATVFIVVVKRLGEQESAKKAVAADFDNGGAASVPLADVAGSVAGTVTSGGSPQPRITVSAF